MSETDKEEPWISRNLVRLLWGIVAVAVTAAIVAASIYFAHLGGLPISDSDPAGWGQLGDYFGGLLNPVFSFLTILALVLTLILQSRELKLSREELELSRTELRNSAEALRGQNKAIDRQGFEQTLFSWLNNYRQLLDSVGSVDSFTTISREVSHGRVAMHTRWTSQLTLRPMLWEIRDTLCPNVHIDKLSDQLLGEKFDVADDDAKHELALKAIIVWDGLYLNNITQLDSLFRILYRLIVWIDSQDKDRLSPAQKWLYVSIVRAQLSWIELVYLFYNGHTERGKNFKRLAEKYALFDNLNFATDPVIAIVRECPPDSVGYQASAYDSRLARVAMDLPESSEQTLAMASDH
jgi:uncharacterized membrane protein